MPHLCPISWSAALLSFWFMFLLLHSIVWWLQLPLFPTISFPPLTQSQTPWNWK